MVNPVAKTQLVRVAMCAVALLSSPHPQYCRAQSLAPIASASASDSSDIGSITQRLDEQEAEIRRLREELAGRAATKNGLEPLPDGSPSNASDEATPTLSGLEDRINALEKSLKKANAPKADSSKDESGIVGPYEVGSDTKMNASWKNGVVFESAHKDFRFHIGGRVQWDISAFDNDPALLVAPAAGGIGPQPDSTQFRRARIRADGTMYETFDWVAEYDFANTLTPAAANAGQPVATTPGLTELTITWTHLPIVGNFRAGNQREPMGMEHLTSDLYLDFIERSYLRDGLWGPYNNGYTPGMTFFDWTECEDATWAVGLYANQADSFGYAIGDEVATTGRLTYLPYYDEPSDGRYLWHIGASGSVRNPDQGQVRVRTRGDIRSGPPGVLNPIYADTGTFNASQQDIAGVETAVVWGSLTLEAEYDGTWVQDATSTGANPVDFGTPFYHGGYVSLLYFLTGEHSVYNRHSGTFEGVTPNENAFCTSSCNGANAGSGAWQLAFRYNTIDLNDNGINGGILDSFTAGVNWYWTSNAKVQFNYDLTRRSEVKTVDAGDINSFGVRFAYYF
ncbi:MAG TPA: porin [Lacipirellulaceae bacterium]|nr:porin [Lacipirellulaceae bacterium]